MEIKRDIKGHIFALITIIIWGTTFISTKILLKSFTPIEILFLRFVIAIAVLTLIWPHRLIIRERKHELYFAAAGLCGVTLYYLFENIALTYTSASNVGIIISIAPFFTAIFAQAFLYGEKLKLKFFVGFVIALAGIYIITFGGESTIKLNPIGDALAVLAAVVWAIYSILTKKISTFNYNTVQSTRRIFLYGVVFIIPALFIFKFNPEPEVILNPVNLLNILYLGLGASALCFVAWNLSVKILGAVKTSVYIYLVPVITVSASSAILNEKITGFTVLGILLTLVGLFVSENKIALKVKGELRGE